MWETEKVAYDCIDRLSDKNENKMKVEKIKNDKGEVVYTIEHRDDCPTLRKHPPGTPHWGCDCPGTEKIREFVLKKIGKKYFK